MARPAISLWWSGIAAGHIDQLLAALPGAPAHAPAGRAVAAAHRQPGLYRRLPHGRAVAPAALHREHHHRRAAGLRQPDARPHRRDDRACGPSSSSPTWSARCSPPCSAPSRRRCRRTCSPPCGRSAGDMIAARLVRHVLPRHSAPASWSRRWSGCCRARAKASSSTSSTLMTYLIALGGFTHIVAGSVEAFLLVAHGELGVAPMLVNFTLPVLARQHRRRHGAVRAALLCPGDEGDLRPARAQAKFQVPGMEPGAANGVGMAPGSERPRFQAISNPASTGMASSPGRRRQGNRFSLPKISRLQPLTPARWRRDRRPGGSRRRSPAS